MFTRLLVPLDGSGLAEQALVAAGDLAHGLSATIVLARAVTPVVPGRSYEPGLVQRLDEAQEREAERYLESTARRLRNHRYPVETHLLRGEVIPELLNLAKSDHCDLIVITSHGMSGLGSRVFGSVAQKLLDSAECPVLVIRCERGDLEREEEREEAAADARLLSELSHAGPKVVDRNG